MIARVKSEGGVAAGRAPRPPMRWIDSGMAWGFDDVKFEAYFSLEALIPGQHRVQVDRADGTRQTFRGLWAFGLVLYWFRDPA